MMCIGEGHAVCGVCVCVLVSVGMWCVWWNW